MNESAFQAFRRKASRYNAVQIDEGLHLVEQPRITETRRGSINHSCDSNLWMADEATVVTRRDVADGEELTVDYALFTTDPAWTMDCNCGSPVCRRLVRGHDWKLPEVQNRYRGHFSPFINRRIAERQR
jgi:uncharacterized protein